MARSDTLRSEIARLEAKGAGFEKDLAAAMKKLNDAESAANRHLDRAARATSTATHRSAAAAAERETKKAADAQKKIADNSKSISTKRGSLSSAEAQEQRGRDREEERRRRSEKQHAREVAQLARAAPIRYVEVRPPEPERLRVLYLTANPEATETTVHHPDGSVETNGVWLRVDYEVRQVKAMLRGSKIPGSGHSRASAGGHQLGPVGRPERSSTPRRPLLRPCILLGPST